MQPSRRTLGLSALVAGVLTAAFLAWMILPLDPFAARSPDRSLTLRLRPADRQHPDSWLEIRMSGPANAMRSAMTYGTGAPGSVETWPLDFHQFDQAWESVLRSLPPQEMPLEQAPDPASSDSGPCGELLLQGGSHRRVYQYRGAMPEILRPAIEAARTRPMMPEGAAR